MVMPPTDGPTFTGFTAALLFAATVQMNSPLGPRWMAASGTVKAFAIVLTISRALTNSPGHSFSSSLAKVALSL